MNEVELYNLLQKAQHGDREAFGLLYDVFRDKIYRFIFFRVGHKELAEDILSDTFVKAWVKIPDITTLAAFNGWIYQVAKNNIIDYYRVKSSATISLDEVSEALEDAASPVDDANLSIEQAQVATLMKDLPREYREVLQYKFLEDLTNLEIASIMNKSKGAVRVLQHRAITKLKQLLRKKITKK